MATVWRGVGGGGVGVDTLLWEQNKVFHAKWRACHLFFTEGRTVWRKSVCGPVFEERGWDAFDKLVSELLKL